MRRAAVDCVVCLLLVASVVIVYGQTAGHQFVNWDDDKYVYENAHVLAGLSRENIKWAFSARVSYQWHPLTLLSLMADAELVRPRQGPPDLARLAAWMHSVNVALHAANVFLLYLLLRSSTARVWPSAIVAAIFAVHPLHVESVAWVTERKDVLSGLFGLWALLAYVGYARRPSLLRYLGVAAALTMGLMAKSMLVTWPLLFLLLDYWPLRRRFSVRLLLEKVPWLLVAGAFAAISIAGQWSGDATVSLETAPIFQRIVRTATLYAIYLGKTVWPACLAAVYPVKPLDSYRLAAAAAILLAALTAIAYWAARRTRVPRPWLIVGWLWYLGTLVPVIGLIQVGSVVMADRFMYLPQIGLCLAFVWTAAEAPRSWRHGRLASAAAAALAVAGLAVCCWRQAGVWRDSLTLWTHCVTCTSENWLAHLKFGITLAERGQLEEAIDQYRQELQIQPRSLRGHINLGNALACLGRFDEAIDQYRTALAVDPTDKLAHYNLGYTLAACGRFDEAIEQYDFVLKRYPDDAIAGRARAKRDETAKRENARLEKNEKAFPPPLPVSPHPQSSRID